MEFFKLENYWPPLETSFSGAVESLALKVCSGMRVRNEAIKKYISFHSLNP